jgi:singapore isolate B (sub-type 7) whole genome shotgun sequence assembly, scaffold_4
MYLVGEGVEKDPETAKNLMKFIEEEEKKLKGNEN